MRLFEKMEMEQYYFNVMFSFKELVDKIDFYFNKFFWLLNEKLNKNFYEFINSYWLKVF